MAAGRSASFAAMMQFAQDFHRGVWTCSTKPFAAAASRI
jgi:hypothetical protein